MLKGKKTILHIIQNFGRGGAETAMVGAVNRLTEYNNIVVALNSLNQFGDELKCDKYYCLNLSSYYMFPLAIPKLRKIIRDEQVDIVHSSLYWSTILARMACPKKIPLVTSIQAALSNSVEYRKKWICSLDRFTYNRRDSIIAGVSRDTLDDYFNFLNIPRRRNMVLYNFVDAGKYLGNQAFNRNAYENFRLVSVGSLKEQKNQLYLLQVMERLQDKKITLDIYGEGSLRPMLEKYIRDRQLPVRLMGQVKNLDEILPGYDLFVMPSLYEGFSLAVLEGMMMETPMFLSDIATFREQCAETALYFPLDNADAVAATLSGLRYKRDLLAANAAKAKERVLANFTLDHHMAALRKIYVEALQ